MEKATLLNFVDTTIIPATGKFVARDKFILDTSDKAELKISWLGGDFKDWMLDKEEEPAGESVLRCQRLRRAEVDGPIIAALGGEKKAEITLSELYGFLKQADKSKWFVCYICDKNELLCAVDAYWHGGGWLVYAGSVEDPDRWRAGNHVLSRNS